MLRIAIDGACRRNGKPDCISSGGVFILHIGEEGKATHCEMRSVVEFESTNQRGELNALVEALKYVKVSRVKEAQIVTDSEYLFNAMTKNWYTRWEFNDWRTASGGDVKNRDLWEKICCLVDTSTTDVTYYHIKGHVMSFGKVSARKLLEADESGKFLYKELYGKYKSLFREDVDGKPLSTDLKYAQDLSYKNNGFVLPPKELRNFVVINAMADAIATKAVDDADSLA